MADPEDSRPGYKRAGDDKRTGAPADPPLDALIRHRRGALYWGLGGGFAVLLLVALFNPSLALLAGGMIVIIGGFGAGVGWVTRWIGRVLK